MLSTINETYLFQQDLLTVKMFPSIQQMGKCAATEVTNKICELLKEKAEINMIFAAPQQLVSLGDSKAYLRIGYIGFEQTWMDRLMNNTPHIQVFDTSKGIDLILNNGEHNHAAGHHDHDGHNHAVEPHIWNSTTNALILAGNTFKALCMLDKPNEAYYLARYDSLCQRIQHTDSLIRRQLSAPESAKAFMIYHPALSYFARDYGLHQISVTSAN